MTPQESRLLEALKDAREVLDLGGARHVLGVDKAMTLIKKVDEALASYEQGTGEVMYTESQMREAVDVGGGNLGPCFWRQPTFEEFIATQRSKVNE